MFYNNSLDKIGQKYGTDKATRYIRDDEELEGHNLLKYYEYFLQNIRNENFTLIEFGSLRGSSLKTFKEYFPNAKIVGIDLKEINVKESRIDIICADVRKLPELTKKIKPYKGTIGCIIDDCNHSWYTQRVLFETFFPLLNSGGYYIVEDLIFGSSGTWLEPPVLDAQPFFDYMRDRLSIFRGSELFGQAKHRPLFSELPKHIQDIELDMEMVSFAPGAIIIKKK